MNILDEIVAYKKTVVSQRKQLTSVAELEKSEWFLKKSFSLKTGLLDPKKSGIIAEFKRKSPSKGIINLQANVEEVTQGYVEAGASALSILTDEYYFDGSDEHLKIARKLNLQTPILRKDFIIDEFQILEAKSMGADIILLIAACLSPDKLKKLAHFARNLGLETILEVHDEAELIQGLNEFIDVVGVNNRNLKLMKTDLNTSKILAEKIPSSFLKISESGISKPEIILDLKQNYGYDGFLIGEFFMQNQNPAKAKETFVSQLEFDK